MYVEKDEQRYGPYGPAGGLIPLHRYRAFKKSRTEERADRIEVLAKQLSLPKAVLEKRPEFPPACHSMPVTTVNFVDPDPFQELRYPNGLAAKRAISEYLNLSLAKLPPEPIAFIDALVSETLKKREVMEWIKDYFEKAKTTKGAPHAE